MLQSHGSNICIGVIGLGYVGLPLAVLWGEKGYRVVGVDASQGKTKDILEGNSNLVDVNDYHMSSLIEENKLSVSSSYEGTSKCDAVFICVSTALTDSGEPHHSLLFSAVEELLKHIKPGTLLIIESTCAPGTMQNKVLPLVESGGFTVGRDIFLAYSPERIDPGNRNYTLKNIPRLVSGITKGCRLRALDFYERLNIPTVSVKNTTVAELAKVLENMYRDVNVALVNEMARVCNSCGVDVWQVIRAASSKPFGYQPFYPGPGVGGSCIPKDSSYYLYWARENNVPAELVERARKINNAMPEYCAVLVEDFLKERNIELAESSVLVLGAAYKKDVGDLRGSPALELIKHLLSRKARVSFHDPFIESLELDSFTLDRVELSPENIRGRDCVVLAVSHSCYILNKLAHNDNILDLTGTLPGPF